MAPLGILFCRWIKINKNLLTYRKPQSVNERNIFCPAGNDCTRIVIITAAAAAAKSLQLCPTLCDSRDGSLPGSPVPGILQARTLEWVVISFSDAWKWKWKWRKWKWSHSVMSDPQRPHGLRPSRLLCPWDFPSKSTGVGCHCLLRIITRLGNLKYVA